jgi:hypothetical protein
MIQVALLVLLTGRNSSVLEVVLKETKNADLKRSFNDKVCKQYVNEIIFLV